MGPVAPDLRSIFAGLGSNHPFSSFLFLLESGRNWWVPRPNPWHILEQWDQVGALVAQSQPPRGFSVVQGPIGPIWIHTRARVLPGAYIEGPAIIKARSTVGPNCCLRGFCWVDSDVVVGQGAEVKASAVLERSTISHFAYLGHSILGRNCSFSAGVITATRRLDGDCIQARWDGQASRTSCKKLGVVIGDGVLIGVGVMIMPGRLIAPGTHVLPGEIVKHDLLGGAGGT